jgi:uncharacterized damage-inducible protein DinB
MTMRFRLVCLATLLFALTAGPPILAQADAPSGFRGDLLRDIGGLEEKVVGLAEAIPADKYGWRPAEGVRSISEALMHLAGANFFFPTLFGTSPPEGVDMQNLEKITDREKVVSTVKASFEHLRGLIQSTPDDKLDDAIKMFGEDSTVAGGLHAAVSHSHEHLGQLIAYARSVGVAPPWSG